MRARRLMMRPFLACVAAFLLAQTLGALPTPDIAAIVKRVESANTTAAVDSYGDYLVRLQTRAEDRRGYQRDRAAQPDLVETRAFIRNVFVELLGPGRVTDQPFDADGYRGVNIIATIPGDGQAPQALFVIGAHYDAEQNPGADDDASGIAALLEAVRVLRHYRFRDTLVFVAFDQEEERRNGWGRGSQFYANLAKQNRTGVRAMVGLDMVAYNHAGGNRATLSRCDRGGTSASAQLSARMRAAFLDYSGLTVMQLTGEDASDPYRFYQAGFPALLVSEEFKSDGWPLNPYYHRPDDFFLDERGEPRAYAGRPYLDLNYAAGIVRGTVGWAATEAGYLRPR